MHDRLHTIHNGQRKSPLSRDVVGKVSYHPGAPCATYKKVEAHRIDAENQRLLKAIVDTKPHVEQVQAQLEEYKKNTVEFKLRRQRRTETDPAKTILSRKSKLMKGIQSRVEQGQEPALPELMTVCHDYSDGQVSANAGNNSVLH